MKRRTEGDVWREVARRLVENKRQGGWGGLCRQSRIVTNRSPALYDATYHRLDGYLAVGNPWAYKYNYNANYQTHCDTHREARTLAALWLACEADADGAL